MIAEQRHEVAAVLQANQLVEHAAAVGATVDVVPERDDRVGGGWINRRNDGVAAPANIHGYRQWRIAAETHNRPIRSCRVASAECL